ncbi:MAG TPA: hypothetical protein PLQ80_06700 [Candidatus Syntrophosphaera sp.]|nr:hypothetical protein [Candidatus Syntrophosphaera sp.]
MKIRTALMTVALVAMLVFSACALKEKAMELSNVPVMGNGAEFVKVVDGSYMLKPVDGGLEMTLNAELLKQLVGIVPDSLTTDHVGAWTLGFKNADGEAVMGMENVPLKEEHKAEIVALMKGLIGDKKELTFMQMIEDKAEVKRILGEVSSIELNTEIVYPELAMAPVPEVPATPAATTPVTPGQKPPVVKPPVPKPPTPPAPPAPTVDDAKINDFGTAVDRYLALKAKNPTTPREITRLTQLRTEAQNQQNALAAEYDNMTGAQKTKYNGLKAKLQ